MKRAYLRLRPEKIRKKEFRQQRVKENYNLQICLNPLLSSVANMQSSAKILSLILEGIIKKISYERRDYDSVDEKSLS